MKFSEMVVDRALCDAQESVDGLMADINNDELRGQDSIRAHELAFDLARKATALMDAIDAYRAAVAGSRSCIDDMSEHRLSMQQLGVSPGRAA